MNCFEFRKVCIAEPRSAAAEYRRHRAECPGCAAFAESQEGFERALTKAVQIDVPPELNARLILRQTTRHSFSLRRTLAYAASILVVLGLVFGVMREPRSPGVDTGVEKVASIDEVVIGHILDEPEHLVSQDEVPAVRAAGVLARVGVTLRGDIGLIRFADLCPGGPGVHLVLAGNRGPVTVMIMPTMPVSARHVLARGGFAGVVVPMGEGSLAIVGFPGEPIDEHEQRVRAAISEII